MTSFIWKENYCVGDAIIDSQHQYLFNLANAMIGSRNKNDLTFNAMRLFRYVREHFRHEEAVMKAVAYPGYQDHVALHEKLLGQLAAISSDIHDDRWSAATLRQFMEGWLGGHIVEEDTKLTSFIRQKQAATAP